MRYLKMYEQFTEGFVRFVCDKYNINNYKIVDYDLTIDVDDDVDMSSREGLCEIPIKFRNVSGDFICSGSDLSTLKGCPDRVGGSFYCNNNKITSLKGCPSIIGYDFYCYGNNIESLEGCPNKILRNFSCSNNELTSLEGGPISVGGVFNCSNNNITNFEGFPIHIGNNSSLFGINNFCKDNPVYNVWTLIGDFSKIELFNDYDIIRGDAIILNRLNSFLDDIGKQYPVPLKEIEGYKII